MLDQKISKYLKGTATSKEEREVHDWITASEKNAAKFNHLKAKYIASTLDVTKVVSYLRVPLSIPMLHQLFLRMPLSFKWKMARLR